MYRTNKLTALYILPGELHFVEQLAGYRTKYLTKVRLLDGQPEYVANM